MDTKKLQFVQGRAKEGEEATIRFFDCVNAWSVSSFNDEFRWLEDYIKPSNIKILVNTEGGSVLKGMSAFSSIINSEIPTEVIVEGLAASMGSVLLAAGDVAKMRDYAIIMIHNPFLGANPENPMVLAFKAQLKEIYKKRWGFSDEKITEVMDGKEGEDGTFLTSKTAVELGIISKDNVIKTELQSGGEVKAALEGINTKSGFADIFACSGGECKLTSDNPSDTKTPIVKSEEVAAEVTDNIINNNNNNEGTMPTNENLAAIAASLNMGEDAPAASVIARVAALQEVESKYTALEKAKGEQDIELAGLTQSLNNTKAEVLEKQKELDKVTADLKVFTDAKIAEVKASQETLIDEAITAGKIEASAKDDWMKMAESNFETVKSTIEGIPAKVVISKEIEKDASKNDEGKVIAQVTGGEKEQAAHAAKVKAVVGDFEFNKLN